MSKYEVNFDGMMRQLRDHIAIDILAKMSPDEKTADSIVTIMSVFVKHGVPVDTAMKIMTELGPALEKHNKKEFDE